MALIQCPECEREVSDQAAACPNCAFPITAATDSPAEAQTIEKTSKTYKGIQLLGFLAALLGGVMAVKFPSQEMAGFALFLLGGGLILIVVGAFGAWWHHG